MIELFLIPLEKSDEEQFIKDNQDAFRYGAMEEFGLRDDHFEEEGEIISKETIWESIREGQAYRIIYKHEVVGGIVVKVEEKIGELELLFISSNKHSQGIGYKAWCELERMYPQVEVWRTCTPYFEKRNIHFYVNRCGFHIVEFFNEKHKDITGSNDEMFLFEKQMKRS